jgi:hypothetical protein
MQTPINVATSMLATLMRAFAEELAYRSARRGRIGAGEVRLSRAIRHEGLAGDLRSALRFAFEAGRGPYCFAELIALNYRMTFTGWVEEIMENNPYAPPASSVEGAPEVARENVESDFRDLGGISKNLSVLLLIGIGVNILWIVSSLMQLNLLSHEHYSMQSATANDLREREVAVLHVVLYIVTAIVFARWIYLAHRNLLSLDARHLRFGPGWAIGCFFVPLINLWGPYQAMRDLAKASRSPRRWELEDTPPVIIIWWVLWLIVEFIDRGAFGIGLRAQTVPELFNLTIIQLVAAVLSIPLYLLALYIVRRITRDQSESYGGMTPS